MSLEMTKKYREDAPLCSADIFFQLTEIIEDKRTWRYHANAPSFS